MRTPETISTSKAPRPVGPYPHAKRVGNLLFLSGIGPRSPIDNSIPGAVLDDEGTVMSYDFEQQCRAVFANVASVLQSANASVEDLVDVTVFLTNMNEDFATMNRIYGEYLPSNGPCRTTVEVSKLPTPIAIELKCIAAIPTSSED